VGCGPLPSGRFAQRVEDPAEPGLSRLDPGLNGNALGLAGKAGDLDRHAEYAGGPDVKLIIGELIERVDERPNGSGQAHAPLQIIPISHPIRAKHEPHQFKFR
jgi:hypothetical protein